MASSTTIPVMLNKKIYELQSTSKKFIGARVDPPSLVDNVHSVYAFELRPHDCYERNFVPLNFLTIGLAPPGGLTRTLPQISSIYFWEK